MSMFGDYKSYKKYEPAYSVWKNDRNITEAKRQAYLKMHPELVNKEDVQRGRVLLRAIDIMDDYSQKKAENMEAATESVILAGLEIAFLIGGALGRAVGSIKPIKNYLQKLVAGESKLKKFFVSIIPTLIGAVLGSFAAFPLMAWGAKTEVEASKKGRFEAMRKELNNPNAFAILNDNQISEAQKIAKNIKINEDEDKDTKLKIKNSFSSFKDMTTASKEYRLQRKNFERELAKDDSNLESKQMSEEEILSAKRNQQILTKLIEKIDIASQDYAENSELATQTAILGICATGGVATIGVNKILKALKIKSAIKITIITEALSAIALLIMGLFSAQINKEASRVGRYKVKKELLKNPNNFVYVDDNKIKDVKNFKIQEDKKQNIFKFLINAWKDNREYKKYKKTIGVEEKKFFKAAEQIKLTPEQLKEAKQLQKNTFRTFNKVDENSQKYAENIEALGQSIAYPITTLSNIIAIAIATPYLLKKTSSKAEKTLNMAKYFGIISLSLVPAIIINTLITREQKKASRIADMKSINELGDYRKFSA